MGQLYYSDYLQLDRVLDCQQLESAKHGEPAHDEMLFIVVHQTAELWFKEILWELDAVIACLAQDVVPDREIGPAVTRLERITAVQHLLIQQLDVLETMTPLDFLDFRDHLIPASGFQSVQFRLIENRLGLRDARLKVNGRPYTTVLTPEHQQLVERSEREASLFDSVARWLERTPFLHVGDYDFWMSYRAAVEDLLERERMAIAALEALDEAARVEQLDRHAKTERAFEPVFDAECYERLREAGGRRLSHRAFLAALLINLYRDEPALQLPFRLLTALIDMDEAIATWRYRHALMAHRMIGAKIGTGGTRTDGYLEAAARSHRVFGDLADLPTYFVPRSALPALSSQVLEQMRFRYAVE